MKTSNFTNYVKRSSGTCNEFIDLHMHSTLSDGALKVRDLIDLCHGQGLTAMAITDHDNIDSYEAGREYASEVGIELIPGVEISSSYEGSDIHILGYFFDPTHLRLNQTLVALRERRRERAMQIVKRLEKLGISLNFQHIAARTHGGSIGRAHIAAQLVEEEYVTTFQEAFNRYLGNTVSLMADIDNTKLSPAEAIELILEAGGVPVMAHPFRTNRDDLLEIMVECGLSGIETYCHGQTQSVFQKYRDFARKYDLICSGGTDFHAKRMDGRHVPGCLKIPYKVLSMLRETVR
jgi:3',5'-nucleoside bisphosphate phosphatase